MLKPGRLFLGEPLVAETAPSRTYSSANLKAILPLLLSFFTGLSCVVFIQRQVGGRPGAHLGLAAIPSGRSVTVQRPTLAMRATQPMLRHSMHALRAEAREPTAVASAEAAVNSFQNKLKKVAALRDKEGQTFKRFRVEALRRITAQGADVPEGTLGIIENGLILWDDGSYSEDQTVKCLSGYRPSDEIKQQCLGLNIDYKLVKTPEVVDRTVSPRKPAKKDAIQEKLGQEVPAEVLGKAYSDLMGLGPDDLVAVLRSDGRWTYAQAIEKKGSSRSRTGVGFMLKVRLADDETKEFPFSEWDNVKQFKQPQADSAGRWGGFGEKPLATALTSKLAMEAENPLMARIGEEVPEEELSKASADLSDVLSGDVVASLRSDGKWTYARVKEFIGTTGSARGLKFGNPDFIKPGEAGTGMLLRVDKDGSEKKVLSRELDKIKAMKAA